MGNETSRNQEEEEDSDGLRELPSQELYHCTQGNDVVDTAASNPDRKEKLSSDIHPDKTDRAALHNNPKDYHFPFENIVLEGGGAKCIAYLGVIKCLEELNMIGQIKRIAGNNVGAILGAMLAFGYTWDEMLELTAINFNDSVFDHSCGLLSLIPNLLKKYGWNRGEKFSSFSTMFIKERTGNPDTTFRELYKSTGMELCIVVTNLNQKTAQYCHPKTTPDMPIRLALRMSMAIPGVFFPSHHHHHGNKDVFVDGGLMVNYPVNCFDGWLLSMKNEDAFLFKVKSLNDLSLFSSVNHNEAEAVENKTIGCIVFSVEEYGALRFHLENRVGSMDPEKPETETKLFCKMEEKNKRMEEEDEKLSKTVKAMESFLQEEFTIDQQELLFGNVCPRDKVMEYLDPSGKGLIEFDKFLEFIRVDEGHIQKKLFQIRRVEIDSLPSFLGALIQTVLLNTRCAAFNVLITSVPVTSVRISSLSLISVKTTHLHADNVQ